jgi:hypothetical protein
MLVPKARNFFTMLDDDEDFKNGFTYHNPEHKAKSKKKKLLHILNVSRKFLGSTNEHLMPLLTTFTNAYITTRDGNKPAKLISSLSLDRLEHLGFWAPIKLSSRA